MGEYEPKDSRNVTQTDHRAPGEPPRTGPREDEARRKAEKADPNKPHRNHEPQQKARQTQDQGSGRQSQSQSQSGLWGNDAPRAVPPGDPDQQEMQAEPDGPPSGNQPQAIENASGASEPHYDQYEVNQPQNMHRQSADEEARVREQAERQDGKVGGFGYGADGQEEMQDAPDASEEQDKDAATNEDPPGAGLRGYGGRGEAAKAENDGR